MYIDSNTDILLRAHVPLRIIYWLDVNATLGLDEVMKNVFP